MLRIHREYEHLVGHVAASFVGDALAVALSEKKGFKEEDFANLHPGGKLGKKLARVESLMHSGDAVPRVSPNTGMSDVIYEMSRKKLGMTTVVEGEKLLGVISDGDLRRLLEHRLERVGAGRWQRHVEHEHRAVAVRGLLPEEHEVGVLGDRARGGLGLGVLDVVELGDRKAGVLSSGGLAKFYL